MGRGLIIVVCTALLGGCALPVPIQIASWALDGISLLATEKSISDHGISMVTQKDCALWRGVAGKEICSDNVDDSGAVLVAAAEPQTSHQSSPEPVLITSIVNRQPVTTMPVARTPEPVVSVEELAVIETSSAPVVDPVVSVEKLAAVEPAPEQAAAPEPEVAKLDVDGRSERLLIPGHRIWSNDRNADLYYVVGSFSKRNNARSFVRSHRDLGPAVMASRLDGNEVYRVAVGPFVDSQKSGVNSHIRKAGLDDAWAIRVKHADWMIAVRPTPKASAPIAEAAPVPSKAPKVDAPDATDELAQLETGTTTGKMFFVIGSFDVADNARSFATETLISSKADTSRAALVPAVVSYKSDDKWRHRVVVGPFSDAEQGTVRNDLAKAGIGAPWSIRLSKNQVLNTPVVYRIDATTPSAPQIAGANEDLPGSG
jgi:hypothetical protein